jgi:AcrR family transcriptional regulator
MDTEASDEIMQATYRALCEYGYAELTMQRIADATEKSKSALHYHYDTKEDLLDAFLEYLVEEFERRFACESADPRERLGKFLAAVYEAPEDGGDFPVALLEIKAQAPYHESYRERLVALDDRMRAVVASAVADGIEAGHFDDADPEEVARFVVTATYGAQLREVSLGEDPTATQHLVESYLEDAIGYAPEAVA